MRQVRDLCRVHPTFESDVEKTPVESRAYGMTKTTGEPDLTASRTDCQPVWKRNRCPARGVSLGWTKRVASHSPLPPRPGDLRLDLRDGRRQRRRRVGGLLLRVLPVHREGGHDAHAKQRSDRGRDDDAELRQAPGEVHAR